jgi:hypothetical protein
VTQVDESIEFVSRQRVFQYVRLEFSNIFAQSLAGRTGDECGDPEFIARVRFARSGECR